MANMTKTKAKKLTAEQRKVKKTQREHKNFVRLLFRNAGFSRLEGVAEKKISYEGVTSDFDDFFVLENVIVICEYTIQDETYVSTHLKKKYFMYNAINKDPAAFTAFLRHKSSTFASAIPRKYADVHLQVRLVYASRYAVKLETKALVQDIIYLDYNILRYFTSVAASVRLSSRHELLDFLDVKANQFGAASIATTSNTGSSYRGSVLPETYSHFPKGYKIVSFYVDAAALLRRAFVVRKNGWREGSEVLSENGDTEKD